MTGGTTATVDSITTAATSALTTLQGDALDMIASVIPVAIVIMGAVLVVTLGIKAFKMISKK